MYKILVIIGLVLLIAACSQPNTNSNVESDKLAVTDSVIAVKDSIIFNLKGLYDFKSHSIIDSSYTVFATQVIKSLNKIINSSDFKDSVLGRKFYTTRYNGSIVPLPDSSIYRILFKPRKVAITILIKKGINNTIQEHKPWPWHPVYGYDDSLLSLDTTMVVYKFYADKAKKDNNNSEYANTIAHEYCHMMGFMHLSEKNYTDIPYGIGYIVQHIIDNWDKKGNLNTK